MKKPFLALFLLTATAAFAQSQTDAEPAPPEMPTNLTFDTDVYFIEPKFTLSYGARGLTGTKASFHGTGHISTSQDVGPVTGNTAARTYHDGTVGLDARTTLIDNGDGTTTSVPISPDGFTNTWSFTSATQVAANGDIAMHTYYADVIDDGPRSKDGGVSFGMEVAATRDMGKITAHFEWKLVGGLSINDINAKMTALQNATITTLTDLYSLNGSPAPTPPYTAPAPAGSTITNADGTTTTTTNDATTLLAQDPESRTVTTAIDNTEVTNHFHLKGAYYTFRAGPTFVIPITQRLRLSFSAGAAVVYVGSTFSVEQDFQPVTGVEVSGTEESTKINIMPGYYVDADLEYAITDRTGLYLGAVHQDTGSFKQSIVSTTADYTTKIDLSNLQGFRMGMNIRF
jgi:hypothetical protein